MTPSQRQQLEVAVKTPGTYSWRPRIDQPGMVATGEAIPLELPPNRQILDAGSWPGPGHRGWPLEAAIGTLKDSAAASDKVLRMLVMFSEGAGGTTTVEEDVAEQAVALGIPIYPVMIWENWNVRLLALGNPPGGPPVYTDASSPAGSRPGVRLDPYARNPFGRLGTMTGGRSFAPQPDVSGRVISANDLSDILKSVRNDGLSQYVVGFVPQPSSDAPRGHKLEIKLASKSSGQLTGGKRQAIY
jgi:hypothetical protein